MNIIFPSTREHKCCLGDTRGTEVMEMIFTILSFLVRRENQNWVNRSEIVIVGKISQVKSSGTP